MTNEVLFQHGQILAIYATESLMRQWCERMDLSPDQEAEVMAGFLSQHTTEKRSLEKTAPMTDVGKIATAAYFHVAHMGGGCLVWERTLDDENGTFAWICDEGNGLGDTPDESYLVGIYSGPDGTDVAYDLMPNLAAAIAWCEVNLMAERFAACVREALSPEEYAIMISLNTSDSRYAKGACASHDFFDANDAMDLAWRNVRGEPIDADDESQAILWGRAWSLARKRYLGDYPARHNS